MALSALPPEAARIAEEQSWNDNSIANLLLQFIQAQTPGDWQLDLVGFLQSQADEENGGAEDEGEDEMIGDDDEE